MGTRTLNVRKVTFQELQKMWELPLPSKYSDKELFIRCDKNNFVDWVSAPIYTRDQLEYKSNYHIFDLFDNEDKPKNTIFKFKHVNREIEMSIYDIDLDSAKSKLKFVVSNVKKWEQI